MALVLDQRLMSIQADPLQVRSINEFTDSLVRELNIAEGMPSKALMRELLASTLQKALDAGGMEPKRRFMEALSVNIHKFPLQEQHSISRVWQVEISSEYQGMHSFMEETLPEEEVRLPLPEPPATLSSGSAAPPPPQPALPAPTAATAVQVAQPETSSAPIAEISAAEASAIAAELKKRLTALPAKAGPAAQEFSMRLLDNSLAQALRSVASRTGTSFFSDLRLNLFKLPEHTQKDLVEFYPELKVEIVRLVESMTKEISRWLDEERIATAKGQTGPLLTKLKALFQAVLSAPFLATFKHLAAPEKKCKEAFLLKIALCLRTCADRGFPSMPGSSGLADQSAQLRRQFFHVEGYGELMEDWLQSRIRELNDEFVERVAVVLASNLPSVLARLKKTLRPGRWLLLSDSQLEEDAFSLFAEEGFPRHVLTSDSMAIMLRKVGIAGGVDFHVYANIVRLAPQRQQFSGAAPQDAVDMTLLSILQRFPAFPALKKIRPGLFLFGSVEVEFSLRGADLVARAQGSTGAPEEVPADEFFLRRGPEQFPTAATMAVTSSGQSPSGTPSTTIEAHGTRSAVRETMPQDGLPPKASPGANLIGNISAVPSFPPQPPAFANTVQGVPLAPLPVSAIPDALLPPPPPPALPALGVSGPSSFGPLGVPGLPSSMTMQQPAQPLRYEPYPAAAQAFGGSMAISGFAATTGMAPQNAGAFATGPFGAMPTMMPQQQQQFGLMAPQLGLQDEEI